MEDQFIEIATKYIYDTKIKNSTSEETLKHRIEMLGFESVLVDDLMSKIKDQILIEEEVTIQLKKTKKMYMFVFIFSLLFLIFSFFYFKIALLNLAGFSVYFITKSKYDKLKKEREYRKTKMRWWLEE